MSNDDEKTKNTKNSQQSSKSLHQPLNTSDTVNHQRSNNAVIPNVASNTSTDNKVVPTIKQSEISIRSNRSNKTSDAKRKLDSAESVLTDLPGPSKAKKKFKINDDGGASAGGSIASSVSSNDQDDSFDGKDDKDTKKKKNRCATCRKKVGLTGFQCRCGGLYCAVHRYSDKHDCSFNYREMGAQEIRRNNPVVVGEKIQKI